jgi:hypothetical protein
VCVCVCVCVCVRLRRAGHVGRAGDTRNADGLFCEKLSRKWTELAQVRGRCGSSDFGYRSVRSYLKRHRCNIVRSVDQDVSMNLE